MRDIAAAPHSGATCGGQIDHGCGFRGALFSHLVHSSKETTFQSKVEDLSLRDLPVPVVSPKSNEDRKLLRRSHPRAGRHSGPKPFPGERQIAIKDAIITYKRPIALPIECSLYGKQWRLSTELFSNSGERKSLPEKVTKSGVGNCSLRATKRLSFRPCVANSGPHSRAHESRSHQAFPPIRRNQAKGPPSRKPRA